MPKCGDGILQRADCTGYEDKNCVETEGAEEVCDDGVNNGKYRFCNKNCSGLMPRCGDGILHRDNCTGYENCTEITGANEICDYGENNGKTECTYGTENCTLCTTLCTEATGAAKYCGDGILQRADCTGYEDKDCVEVPGADEKCDDGKENNGKYGFCDSECKEFMPKCGDGILQRADCTGYEDKNCIVTEGAEEVCDDGEENGHYDKCNSKCTGIRECGDGVWEVNLGEACDDGEENGHYNKCNEACNDISGSCGDATVQKEHCEEGEEGCVELPGGTEECDDGFLNGKITECTYSQKNCWLCSNSCTMFEGTTFYCGDGQLQRADCTGYEDKGCIEKEGANEECDEGEDLNGKFEHCNSACTGIVDYKCGDGQLQRADCTGYEDKGCIEKEGADEECDDGEELNGQEGHCDSNCAGPTPYCNDGIIQREDCTNYENCVEVEGFSEECDDGLMNGALGGCLVGCGGMCGDGKIQREDCTGYSSSICEEIEGASETCDEGFMNGQTDHCNNYCNDMTPNCGDGTTQFGETCDDGEANGTVSGGCNTTCDGYMPACGDGKIQREDCTGYDNCEIFDGYNEECDDGNLNGASGGCREDCSGKCGDGIFQRADCSGYGENCHEVPGADEECDDGTNNGSILYCNSDCSGATPYCGDNIIQRSDCTGYEDKGCVITAGFEEKCDDGENNGQPTYCNSSCTEYINYRCGDGIFQRADCTGYGENCHEVPGANEKCDDGDDFNGQPGYCNSYCTGATPYCGNGIIDPGEECDEGDSNGTPESNCTSNCTSYRRCGDGEKQSGERCDEGENNGKYGHCNSTCSGYIGCGDKRIQKADISECGSITMCNNDIVEDCCEVVAFNSGDQPELCDDGSENGYHGHCNKTCSGYSVCGDSEVGFDEICEQGVLAEADQIECSSYTPFSSGTITSCDLECQPVMTSCGNAEAFTPPFFTTSQSKCYNTSEIIPCPDSGTFYDQEPNILFTLQSFETLENGIIFKESVSNLMWQAETPTSYEGCAEGNSCSLTEAENYCKNLSLGNYTKWRLPTIAELSTIADFDSAPHILSIFQDAAGDYWTKEGAIFSSDNGTFTNPDSTKTAGIKCVRSNCTSIQCKTSSFYQYSNSAIMQFSSKNSKTTSFWYFDLSTSPAVVKNWENALAYCAEIEHNGLNAMRLPTVNELISIINRYPQDPTNGYSAISGLKTPAWTSTTSSENAAKAYVVDFSTGTVVTDFKSETKSVICIE